MQIKTSQPTYEFNLTESEVRYYCRSMPAVFTRARNAHVWDEDGLEYIDFLSACGSLNYGHNHPVLKSRVLQHLAADGVLNGLDMHTVAKRDFLRTLREQILEPRGLNYRVQFTGPTGTNAVEAALKLARKVTGRRSVVSFTNAFHGMTLGAMSVSGKARSAATAGLESGDIVRLPFEGYQGAGTAELDRYAAMAGDPTGGVEPPAAFILETVQGEGGLNTASKEWLQHLAGVARGLGALLIIDDIQAGCGRTGSFFSFERCGIEPDLVCLSKSLSGIGLPMSLLLIRPEYDQWRPGEHNGTFRGNNLAFVSATAALELWREPDFLARMGAVQNRIRAWTEELQHRYGDVLFKPKGIGLMTGLAFTDKALAGKVARRAYRRRVLIETSGPYSEVLKIMPPLTIEKEVLEEGLSRLGEAIEEIHASAGTTVGLTGSIAA